MGYIVADRIKETTTSTGTGTITLGGAVSGYRSFASQMTIGDTCAYAIVSATGLEWETGIATYSAANTLTRTTIHASTNGNAAVVFSSGTKDVFMAPTANTILPPNGSAASLTNFPTLNQNTTGTAANVTGIVAVANGGTGVTTSTGTGSVVLSNTPTLVAPQTNALSSVPVVSGAGNNLTFTAGSGVTSGAGGSLILQAGRQATTGGDGAVIVKQVAGQNAYLFQIQDSSGTAAGLFNVSANAYSVTSIGSFSTQRVACSSSQVTGDIRVGSNHISWSQYVSTTYGFVTSNNISWASSVGDLRGLIDLTLSRDAADTLAQRRTTNAQTFRVYNTYTDASNYERLGITWASNICTIGLAQAGTGSVRSLVIAGANATSGAGGNVTITAGNGSGVGAGGNIILQPGAQGSSGGNGIIQCNKKLQFYTGSSKTDLAFQINNSTTGMWYHSGANMFVWTINSADTICFRQGYIRLSKGGGIYWSNTTNDAITLPDDTSIYSASRGVFAVDASMQGTNSQGGSLAFRSFTTNFAANTNDWVMGPSAFQRLNCTTACSLTGIAPYTSGVHVDGRMIRIYNVGTANLTLSHNSTSSITPANRFWNSTGADIVLSPHQYVELIYDSTDNGRGGAGWRVSSVH